MKAPFRELELLTGLGGITPADGVWGAAGGGEDQGADVIRIVRVLDGVRIGLLDGIGGVRKLGAAVSKFPGGGQGHWRGRDVLLRCSVGAVVRGPGSAWCGRTGAGGTVVPWAFAGLTWAIVGEDGL